MKKTRKLLLIDTFNFLHRAYHALPKTFTDAEGNPTNAVFGVTSMFINIFDTIQPDYAVAALDSEKPTFRVEEFTGYKAHRKPMENELSVQIQPVFDVIDAFGIKRLTVDGYEADDVIGTLTERFKGNSTESGMSSKTSKGGLDIIIASNDRDMWQLVDDHVTIMIPTTKGQAQWIGEKEVVARMGFTPDKLVDYKGLRGDPSDNIPGVYGVGEKTAKKLIANFDSIEGIYKNIDEVKPDSLKEKLLNNYEEALMSKKLARILTDMPLEVELEECRYQEFNKVRVKDTLEKYNFKSLIKRLGFEADPSKKKPEVLETQTALL